MNDLVFVYGSLKRGCYNHILIEHAKFIRDTVTTHAYYEMYPANDAYPIATHGDKFLTGEVYEVDSKTLRDLDKLEGEGIFYKRQKIYVDGVDRAVWIYLIKDAFYYSDFPTHWELVVTEGSVQTWAGP